MAGRNYVPKGDKEELLYYKGIYQINKLVNVRIGKMIEINELDKQIAKIVVDLKRFVSWRELGEMMGMTEAQAKSHLMPLMGSVEDDPS